MILKIIYFSNFWKLFYNHLIYTWRKILITSFSVEISLAFLSTNKLLCNSIILRPINNETYKSLGATTYFMILYSPKQSTVPEIVQNFNEIISFNWSSK